MDFKKITLFENRAYAEELTRHVISNNDIFEPNDDWFSCIILDKIQDDCDEFPRYVFKEIIKQGTNDKSEALIECNTLKVIRDKDEIEWLTQEQLDAILNATDREDLLKEAEQKGFRSENFIW